MALETAFYLVTEEVAIRSGIVESRHRAQDGRFILNDRDLSRIRFGVDEYINGLQGVEKITAAQAKKLIRDNNFSMGLTNGSGSNTVADATETAVESDTSENENQNEETEE